MSRPYRSRHTGLAALLLWLTGPAAAVESTTAVVSTRTVALNELDCLIEPHRYIELASPVDGVLDTVEVERGDLIERDQLLGRLRSDVERLAVELAQARLETDDAVSAKRASRDFGRRQRARSEELFSKNMLSSQERDQARTEALIADLELRQAEAQKRIEALELEQAQRRLEQRELRSPIRGVVVERLVAPGESVDDRPVFRLAQLDPLNVELIVPVSSYGAIQSGMVFVVIPEAPLDDQRYRATVKIIDRVVDAASGTFGVRLELPNPDYRLPAGLRCRVEFIAG